MVEIDRFEISLEEKEMIKMRLLFMIVYFKDRVIVREEYVDKMFSDYNEEFKEIEDCTNEVYGKALMVLNLIEIQYRLELTFLCLVCQMFEQFLIDIIVDRLKLDKGLYFEDVKFKFNEYGFDCESINSWKKIEELRLLVNVIKHADGKSREKLQKIKPNYFYCDPKDMIKNTINDMKLNIETKDFFSYCTAIIEFINKMPNRFEKEA